MNLGEATQPTPRVSGNSTRFIVICLFSVIGLIAAGVFFYQAETTYASTYSSFEQQAEQFAGTWIDSGASTDNNMFLSQLQFSVNTLNLTIRGKYQDGDSFGPFQGTFLGSPLVIAFSTPDGTGYNLNLRLQPTHTLMLVVTDTSGNTTSNGTFIKHKSS